MNIFLTFSTAGAIKKLEKNNSYSSLRQEIYQYLNGKTSLEHWTQVGSRLNSSVHCPFVRDRVKGSGGYRIYYSFLVIKGQAVIAAVHPKTGTAGKENLSRQERNAVYLEAVQACQSGEMLPVTLDHDNTTINF